MEQTIISTTTDYEPEPLTAAHLEASSQALTCLTNDAEKPTTNTSQPPGCSTSLKSHHWLSKRLPKPSIEAIEHRFHLGNYVLDRETGVRTFEAMNLYVRIGMHLLFYGSEQKKVLHWQRTIRLLKEQSEKMGRKYDCPSSKQHIQGFIRCFGLEDTLHECVEPDWRKYSNFNAFFAREIREDARPVVEPENEMITSSPADCRLTAFPTVDLATRYWIKGFGFSIEKLLGDADMAAKFEGGSIVIARLAPQDYHRWHAPIAGTVRGIKEIPGTYYTVNPQAITEPGTLDVFCENRRSVMTLERTATGSTIAFVAVGAMLVGSIQYADGVQVGTKMRRGQCLGKFCYGGSTVIVLYPRGEVTLDEDLIRNSSQTNVETYVKVGWRLGVMRGATETLMP
jgi:phosphatidylserine decarboxylase